MDNESVDDGSSGIAPADNDSHSTAPFIPDDYSTTDDMPGAKGDWHIILDKTDCTISRNGADLVVTTRQPKNLSFSSSENQKFFGPVSDTSNSNAAVGDNHGSAVMLLDQPSTALSDTLIFLLEAFGVANSAGSKLGDAYFFVNKLIEFLDQKIAIVLVPNSIPATPDGSAVKFTEVPNAMWFTTSDEGYSSRITLNYNFGLGIQAIVNWASDQLKLSMDKLDPQKMNAVKDVTLTLSQHTAYFLTPGSGNDTQPQYTSIVASDVSLGVPFAHFKIYVDIRMYTKSLLLVPNADDGSTLYDLMNGAFPQAALDTISFGDWADGGIFADIFKDIKLWYAFVTFADGATSAAVSQVMWQVALLTSWHRSDQDVDFSLVYSSDLKMFSGRLLLRKDFPDAAAQRSINYDPRISLANRLTTPKDSIDLVKLFSGDDAGIQNSPLPLSIDGARVTVAKGDKSATFTLHASFVRPGASSSTIESSDSSAPFPLTWESALVDVKKVTGSSGSLSVNISLSFSLHSNTNAGSTPTGTHLQAAISYSKMVVAKKTNTAPEKTQSIWIMQASLSSISVADLMGLFGDDRDAANSLLQNLTIAGSLLYVFDSKKASSFLVVGVIKLGLLEFDLSFYSNKKPTSPGSNDDAPPSAVDLYEASTGEEVKSTSTKPQASAYVFEASLRVGSQGTTIGQFLDSLKHGSSDELPDFVSGILINPGADADTPTAMFRFASEIDADKTRHSMMTCWLSIAGISLTFVQMRSGKEDDKSPAIKRLLRISVDQIPLMHDIPVVGSLPQPFDHLEYVWVSDSSFPTDSIGDRTKFGFTTDELNIISDLNSGTGTAIPPFQVKQTESQNKTSPSSDAKALCAGHHFIVIVGNSVVLDHVFDTNSADSRGEPQQVRATASETNPSPPKEIEEAPPTKGATKTKAGGLSIDALTFKYKSGNLVVGIDATLALGPITFSVVGFTITIKLRGIHLNNLSSIITDGLVSTALHGMEVGYQSGPLTLKGVFVENEVPDGRSYRGGIAVGFKVWQVLAVGEYFVSIDPITKKELSRSVFIYGKLDGPLIELEFATISGVRLGFGYNYSIRMPNVSELYKFPLINDSGSSASGSDPMAVVKSFLDSSGSSPAFVAPRVGSGWFAAGMTITAFDVLKLTAVLVVDIDTGAVNPNDKGVILALFADGVFQMEPEAPPEWSLFYIELLVKVELNFVHGYIAAEAALAPASHIYVPFAHLTGSASFYSWFGNNPHAGDWVVTIGGYARSYKALAWYPQVDRIALSFTVGDCIQILGQAYMAVTPQCAMGGGSLHLSLSVGPISAYADLIFDAFINFKPFHFRAELSIDVGVECDIDIWFIHIHISISIGADLVIWGPHDFGGTAHVDFWFFGFDIAFGALENPDASKAISLEDFCKMVICPGPPSAQPAQDTIGSTGVPAALHKYSIEDGIAPSKSPSAPANDKFPSTGATSVWSVLAGTLVFRIDCSFALSSANYTTLKRDGNNNVIYDDQKHPVTTDTEINLPLDANGKRPLVPDIYSFPMHISQKDDLNSVATVTIYRGDNELMEDFKPSLVLKSAAPALWSSWSENKDPLHSALAADSLKDPANNQKEPLMLVTAIRFVAPDPVLCKSTIIDFDATAAMREPIDVEPPVCIPAVVQQDPKPSSSMANQPDYSFVPTYHDPPVPIVPKPSDPDKPTTTAVPGPKRWVDFQALWQDSSHDTYRAALLTEITDLLEWSIRPPEQMSGNQSADKASGAAPPIDTRENKSDETIWKLCSDRPKMLIDELDKEYSALPWLVKGTPMRV